MNSLLDASVDITIDHTSETLIWREQRGEVLGLATYDQLSETDIEWITLVEKIRRHNELLIEYFTLLEDLATSDTPEGAKNSIDNITKTLGGVGEDLESFVEVPGEITQLIVSGQIRGALRDELEQRKDVIQYELILQELLLAKLAEQLKGRLTETREFQETRLIKPRLLAPEPMDIDEQQDWIDERRKVLSSQTTAEQLIVAKEVSTKFRELFERFVEGGLTTSRINITLKITFLSPAERELDEAVDYYEAQKPGLGNEFLEKVRAAVELIECYPGAWQLISRNARQYRISRFPYGVIYQIRV